MKERTGTSPVAGVIVRAALALAATVASGQVGAAQAPTPGEGSGPPGVEAAALLSESTQACLSCHESEGMTAVFADGSEVDVFVDPDAFARSAHGQAGLDCETCHLEVGTDYPHPELTISLRDWRFEQQHVCAGCHSEGKEFDLGAHGRALTRGDPDVPDCTTCHGDAHAIGRVSTSAFRASIPDTCASCHGNDELMAKHGVMTGTVSSYEAEFHGMTASLLKEAGAARIPVAVCSDCHGVHKILPASDPNSTVFVTNLVTTCRKCHPDSTEAFATAWSRHRNPESHPLVGGIAWFYRIVTGISVLGFLGYIGLELAHQRARKRGL
ncbi:MAG: cytochrome c3 family protein [Bacillota bacterium]